MWRTFSWRKTENQLSNAPGQIRNPKFESCAESVELLISNGQVMHRD